ncbi:MAG: uridine kinase [Planctomycetota bacterium]|jgi:uridine kinase
MAETPILIGIAGGTGSGKSTVVRALKERFGQHEVTVIEQDYYYKANRHLPLAERARINYDHPDAFDNDLLLKDLKALLEGNAIKKPVYDFVHHTRAEKTIHVIPSPVILLEGILVLESRALRDLMHIKLFVDTAADVRVLRRLERDIETRGRTLGKVIEQYLNTVRPMHLQFVEPTKRHADLIIPEGGRNMVALDMLITKIGQLLTQASQVV